MLRTPGGATGWFLCRDVWSAMGCEQMKEHQNEQIRISSASFGTILYYSFISITSGIYRCISFRHCDFLVVPSPAFPHGLEESVDAVRCCQVLCARISDC